MSVEKLFKAIKDNDVAAVKKLIQGIPRDDFDGCTDDGNQTALMVACEFADLEIIKLLLESGADVGWDLKYSADTVLKALARGKHEDLETLEVLISALGEEYMPHQICSNGNDDGEEYGDGAESPLEIVKRLNKDMYIKRFSEFE